MANFRTEKIQRKSRKQFKMRKVNVGKQTVRVQQKVKVEKQMPHRD